MKKKSSSKLSNLLNRWFDNCGFETISRITGTSFIGDISQIDYMLADANTKWNMMSSLRKFKAYKDFGFNDHVFPNERTFLIRVKYL